MMRWAIGVLLVFAVCTLIYILVPRPQKFSDLRVLVSNMTGGPTDVRVVGDGQSMYGDEAVRVAKGSTTEFGLSRLRGKGGTFFVWWSTGERSIVKRLNIGDPKEFVKVELSKEGLNLK